MISYDTIGRLIEGRFSVSAHCFAQGCGHSARLDLVGLAERLGDDFVAVGDPNPLVKLLRCQKCGGKDLGIILQPVTGYTSGSLSDLLGRVRSTSKNSPIQSMPPYRVGGSAYAADFA